jgi:hypothetical protein
MPRSPNPKTPKVAKTQRGRAGGRASGAARKRSDNLEIWEAYQVARGKRKQVQALARRFELTERRIQQIGNGPRPRQARVLPESEGGSDVSVGVSLGEIEAGREENAALLITLEEALGELHLMATRLAKDLALNQPGQPDMFGHRNAGRDLQTRIEALRKTLQKKIFQLKNNNIAKK